MPVDEQILQAPALINLPVFPEDVSSPEGIANYLRDLEHEINGALDRIALLTIQRVDVDEVDYLNPFSELVVAQASSTTLTITGVDATSSFPSDRRLRFTIKDTGVQQLGYVDKSTSASFSAGVTTVTIVTTDGTALDAATDQVEIAASAEQQNIAYRDQTSQAAALALTANVGGSAFRDTGTSAANVPLVSQLGTILGETVPLGLKEGAFEDIGEVIGELAANTEAEPLRNLAYVDVPARSFTNQGGDDDTFYTWSTDVALPSFTDIAVPGSPDGSKKYQVSAMVTLSFNDVLYASFSFFNVNIRYGPNGDDTKLTGSTSGLTKDTGVTQCALGPAEFTPASGDKVTIEIFAVQDATADEDNVKSFGDTSGSYSSTLLIEEILEAA